MKIRIKETYLLILIVLGLVSLSVYSTYALFTKEVSINNVVSFNATLANSDSKLLEYELISLLPGETKTIELNVTNSYTESLYYGCWYEIISNNDDITIGIYTEKSTTLATGTVAENGNKNIVIGIVNNSTTTNALINLGVVGSLTENLGLSNSRIIITDTYTPSITVTEEYLESHTTTTTGSINLEYTTPERYSVILTPGTYLLETWGAQGGSYERTITVDGEERTYIGLGGKGGYSKGTITLTNDTNAFLYVGGKGLGSETSNNNIQNGGFNGGGSGDYSGGGASDIRIGTDSLYARVIVAGGGGGGDGHGNGSTGINTYDGGYGGGTSGGTGVGKSMSPSSAGSSTSSPAEPGGAGGTQISAGSSYYNTNNGTSSYGTLATFGVGGGYNTTANKNVNGGGGGWYGGGFSSHGAGGGSGYVYTSSTASNYPTGCLLNSSYYLTNAETIAGNTTFTDFNGTNVTGHTGNGAVRISGTGEVYNYSIPVVKGLTTLYAKVNESVSLTDNVTYVCENGGTSCTYTGPDITNTNTLEVGTYTIYYSIKSGNNTSYRYPRQVIVYDGIIVTKEYLESHTTTTTENTVLEYTSPQTYTVTLDVGTYLLETWGAEGGSALSSVIGGKGGYSKGTLTLTESKTVYVYPGGQGSFETPDDGLSSYDGGFNGGGASYSYFSSSSTSKNGASFAGSGGGASDIRIGTNSLYARVIVAGGGGGAGAGQRSISSTTISASGNGGSGGGTTGISGSTNSETFLAGLPGTQTSYGTSHYGTTENSNIPLDDAGTFGTSASFGVGGGFYPSGSGETTVSALARDVAGISGGGGGFYGGGYSFLAGAGGGSGYVYTSSTASNYPSGCLLNSSYYLTNAETIAGNASFTDFDGETVTGHSGNGAVRITKQSSVDYTIPRILGLGDITITKGTSYNLTNGVTYHCATGSTTCTNVGPNITSTTSLTKGTHIIYYTIKYNNVNYMYDRKIIVT